MDILSKFKAFVTTLPVAAWILAVVIVLTFLAEIIAYFFKIKLPYKAGLQQISTFVIRNIFGIRPFKDFPVKLLVEANSIESLNYLVVRSHELSHTVFKRAISYFIFGLAVSVFGIVLLIFRTKAHATDLSATDLALRFVERIGIPVFVETIAFYLFRQFRIAMDDFKYYNQLARTRESQLLMVKLYQDSKMTKDDRAVLIDKLRLFYDPDIVKEDHKSMTNELRIKSNEEMKLINALRSILAKEGTV
jgi:hypothetical protein